MTTPEVDINLPGIGEVVQAEIGIVREDIERLESGLRATCTILNDIDRRIVAAQSHYRALKRTQDELSTKAATEKRMLTARRRLLFEMEQEVR